jgi:hypothetical protein
MNCLKGRRIAGYRRAEAQPAPFDPEVRDVHHVHVWLVGKNR